MAQEQTVSINFSQGLDTKTDPWQVAVGKFESLENMIFQKGGLLLKRNGYGLLNNNPPTSNYLTTLSGNLVSVGDTVSAFSSSLSSWITKGTLSPCSVGVLPLIRNNLNQTQSDSVVANGMVLTVYTEVSTTYNSTTASFNDYKYVLADATTGQNIVSPSHLPVLTNGNVTGSSRVAVVGNYFVIVTPVTIVSTVFLQYCSIPINNPILNTGAANISAAQNVFSEAYVPVSSNPGWDIVVTNDTLVVAYNTTSGGQGIHVASLLASQIAANSAAGFVHSFTNAAYIGALVSTCVDSTTNPNVVYISFWNNATSNGYTCAVTIGFGTITNVFTPQQIITTTVISNLASAAQSGSCLVLSEVVNAYSYDGTIPSHYIVGVTVSAAGSVGTPFTAIRSLGLASKAFIINDTVYALCTYQSPFQPTYFLVNLSVSRSSAPVIVAKLAYQNGGGYLTLGLPSVSINESVASIPYLFKDDVEALSTANTTSQTTVGGIYSQTGINFCSFTLETLKIDTSEIASALHISGGYLSMFDGFLPVEHNFFLFPDSVEVTWNASSIVTPTGTWANGATTITLSSATGVAVGMTITDTSNAGYIPSGTIITALSGTTATISQATTSAASGDNLSIQGRVAAVPSGGAAGSGAYYYQVTYEWTDNNGLAYKSAPSIAVTTATTGAGGDGSFSVKIPTLRLTAKTTNKVKIVVYRWSEFTQVYNQVTSITQPVLNDTTVDSVTFIDPYADTSVIGNNILYTTGGVVPDYNAPSSNIITLFDTRLWLVDAEDPNILWVSKQVIPNTPVEMSTLFKIYVAPNIGTEPSSGPITALAPMDDKLIIFKKNAIYYINGVGPNNLGTTSEGCSLGNYSQPIFVTSVVGCDNQASIVLTQDGLMFQSDKGIWLVRRNLQTVYIGAPVERYNTYDVTSANVIPDTNYVVFTLSNGPSLMYDYYFGQWGTFTGFSGVSSTVYNGLHTVLTPFGQILQETPSVYLDATNPVLMSFATGWIHLAGLQGYQRFYDFYLLAKYISPHFLQCQVAYDYNESALHQAIVGPKNFSPISPSPFGVPTPFGSAGNKEQWRVDTKKQLCESFKLTVKEVFNPTLGVSAGAGFTMSGIDLTIGVKSTRRPIRGTSSTGLS